MTQTSPFDDVARIDDVARFFAGLAENATYAVATDSGHGRTFHTRTSARRFAEAAAARDGAGAEVWSAGRPLAVVVDHLGWCVPIPAVPRTHG